MSLEPKRCDNKKSLSAVIAAIGTLLLHCVLLISFGIYGGLKSSENPKASIRSTLHARLIPTGSQEPTCIKNCYTTNIDAAKPVQDTLNYPLEEWRETATDKNNGPVFSGSGLGLTHYYEKSELTLEPQIVIDPRIVLPEGDDAKIIGAIKLRLLLSDLGDVDAVHVIDKTMPENYVLLIVEAFKKIVFKPGELNGKAVRSQLQFEVSFQRDISQQSL